MYTATSFCTLKPEKLNWNPKTNFNRNQTVDTGRDSDCDTAISNTERVPSTSHIVIVSFQKPFYDGREEIFFLEHLLSTVFLFRAVWYSYSHVNIITGADMILGFCTFCQLACRVRNPCKQKYRNTREASTTATAIGLPPRHAAVRTSNRLIDAIKSQRLRALLKRLLPAATDPQSLIFSLHPPDSAHLLPVIVFASKLPFPLHSRFSALFLLHLSRYEFDALPMGKHRG